MVNLADDTGIDAVVASCRESLVAAAAAISPIVGIICTLLSTTVPGGVFCNAIGSAVGLRRGLTVAVVVVVVAAVVTVAVVVAVTALVAGKVHVEILPAMLHIASTTVSGSMNFIEYSLKRHSKNMPTSLIREIRGNYISMLEERQQLSSYFVTTNAGKL
uniref:Uncharacterized protein n=1 Tax=Glossina pallidipes TaxID=7398 RepID=A0A1B0ACZ4_GLOPL